MCKTYWRHPVESVQLWPYRSNTNTTFFAYVSVLLHTYFLMLYRLRWDWSHSTLRPLRRSWWTRSWTAPLTLPTSYKEPLFNPYREIVRLAFSWWEVLSWSWVELGECSLALQRSGHCVFFWIGHNRVLLFAATKSLAMYVFGCYRLSYSLPEQGQHKRTKST